MILGINRIWINIRKNEEDEDIVIGVNYDDYGDYFCNCDDSRHLYFNRFPNFKCKCYDIAMEKLKRALYNLKR